MLFYNFGDIDFSRLDIKNDKIVSLPDNFSEIFEERTKDLTADESKILGCAAFIGVSFDANILAHALKLAKYGA